MSRLPTIAEYVIQIVTRCPIPALSLQATFQKIMNDCARAADAQEWPKALYRCLDARAFAFAHKFALLVSTAEIPENQNPIWPDSPNTPLYIQFQRLELMIRQKEQRPL